MSGVMIYVAVSDETGVQTLPDKLYQKGTIPLKDAKLLVVYLLSQVNDGARITEVNELTAKITSKHDRNIVNGGRSFRLPESKGEYVFHYRFTRPRNDASSDLEELLALINAYYRNRSDLRVP